MTIKEEIQKLKDDIRNSGYKTFETRVDERYGGQLIGTFYLKEKTNYGFHLYFIYEPEANNYAGKDGIVCEFYYNLREKKYFIKRNLKPVKFSRRNIDTMFPSTSNPDDVEKMFDYLSTEGNTGLYKDCLRYLGSMGLEHVDSYGRFFYRLMTNYSHFELLHKANINLSSVQHMKLNSDGKNPREVFGISKSKWKMYTKYGIGLKTIRDLPENREADKFAMNMFAYLKRLEREFGIGAINDFARQELKYIYYIMFTDKTIEDIPRYRRNWAYNRSTLKTGEEYDLNIKKLIKYIYFECRVSQGLNSSGAIDDYSDYIRMIHEMEFERFEKYPKHLRTEHDVIAMNYKVKLSEIEEKQWNDIYNKSQHLTFKYKDYCIIVPEKPDEVIKEGNILSHCVASYVNKVLKGYCNIVFLRKVGYEDEPLVTVEIRDNKVYQARGKMNRPMNQSEKDFMKRYKNKLEKINEESAVTT